jgi:hypothetical protein
MCVVADPPTFIPMFKPSDREHAVFAPVAKWVMEGAGKFVIGGTTYREQLRAVSSIVGVLLELERIGKVVRYADIDVDSHEAEAKRLEPGSDFDDPHLVALVRLTKCKLVCVRDKRSHKFLRAAHLYSSSKDRPKLYTRRKNQSLLCPKNIAACCRG